MSQLEIYPDHSSLAQATAEHVAALAIQAIVARGQFTVALAGGSTPHETYTKLASDPLAPTVDWSYVHVLWSDERMDYPPNHPDSNYRMARETLLDHVPLPSENVHPIQSELDPQQAAERYEEELRTILGTEGRFDLILLGMGADGHTASLSPGTAAIHERDRWAVENYVQKLDAWRVTLTFPIINAARHVTFLVSGAVKAKALAHVRAGVPLPAAQVQPVRGNLTWMVDQAAIRNTV